MRCDILLFLRLNTPKSEVRPTHAPILKSIISHLSPVPAAPHPHGLAVDAQRSDAHLASTAALGLVSIRSRQMGRQRSLLYLVDRRKHRNTKKPVCVYVPFSQLYGLQLPELSQAWESL